MSARTCGAKGCPGRGRHQAVTGDPPTGADVDTAVLGRALLQAGSADPAALVADLRMLLTSVSLATDLALYLVDYRLTALLPIQPHGAALLRPEPVDGPFVGAAHRQQQPVPQNVPAGQLLHVPVTVRGQRLGVLTATFPGPPPPHEQRAMASVALAAAYLLLEAGTGSDVYEVGRRQGRLSLAAEMQWQLLPARAYRTPQFYVAGHLEPALTVAGDAFDFAFDDTTLSLAVVDAGGSGSQGSSSALLATLTVTALRNARRAGLPLHEQAELASDLVFAHTRGQQHACVLLLHLDARANTASAIDAGGGALIRLRNGSLQRQVLDRQPPLGMLDDARYGSQRVDLAAGDRAYVLADTSGGDLHRALGLLEQPQAEEIRATPPEAVRRLVVDLLGGRRRDDDTTIVCLDWSDR